MDEDLPLRKEFDPAPLLAFIERRAAEHAHACTGKHAPWSVPPTARAWVRFHFGENSGLERQLTRWRAGATLSWWYADKVAGMLRVHPSWIWPDWFDLEVEHEREDVAA